jgi:glutamyl-tRNA synthetase
MTKKVRVRFAPSPTGELHIGGVRTALFNWLFARHHQGKFILRIEDTDAERSKEESTQQIIAALNWIGLNWDEGPGVEGNCGPYFQSQRMDFYRQALDYLLEKNRAYYCYCTQEEIAEMKKEAEKAGKPAIYPGHCRNLTADERDKLEAAGRKPVVRLKTPDEGYTVVKDLIRGKVSFENRLQEDLIIAKSNNHPTYNFACVVDDHAMGISHVIRAEEHLSNTPKQIMLYNALDYELPAFAHVPMILAPDRSKLSKRHGATSVDEFKKDGYLPQALINYLLLLGWSPGNDEEIMPLSKAINYFSLEGVSANPAIYDTKKLTWANGQYMRDLPLEEIMRQALPLIQNKGYIDNNPSNKEYSRLSRIVDVVRERSNTLLDLVDGISYFYDDSFTYKEKDIKKHFQKEDTITILENNLDCLKRVEPFKQEAIEEIYRNRSKELGIKTARMIHTTRLALSGRTFGPGLFFMVEILGRDEAIKRLTRALDFCRKRI